LLNFYISKQAVEGLKLTEKHTTILKKLAAVHTIITSLVLVKPSPVRFLSETSNLYNAIRGLRFNTVSPFFNSIPNLYYLLVMQFHFMDSYCIALTKATKHNYGQLP